MAHLTSSDGLKSRRWRERETQRLVAGLGKTKGNKKLIEAMERVKETGKPFHVERSCVVFEQTRADRRRPLNVLKANRFRRSGGFRDWGAPVQRQESDARNTNIGLQNWYCRDSHFRRPEGRTIPAIRSPPSARPGKKSGQPLECGDLLVDFEYGLMPRRRVR